MADAASERLIGNVDMAYLMRGVHTGVRTTGDSESGWFSMLPMPMQDSAQRLFNGALHGPAVGLHRPPVEVGAVIGQVDS